MLSCKKKMDSLVAKNAQMKQDMAENQAKNGKYHHVIDTAMSVTQATEETERDKDNTTIHTQWSGFTANHETSLANMQKRLE